jgi:IclR family transcriptional regulator, pca regulon regulatory protein
MAVDLRVGSRLPAFYTSMGRVPLANLPPEEYEACIARIVFTPMTDRTVRSREKLRQILKLVRRNSYAIVGQELELGLRSLAVRIQSPVGRVVAALNVGTHAQRVAIQDLQVRFLPHLQAGAQELSILLR